MDLRWVTPDDEDVVARSGFLFDDEPRPEWTQRFLAQPDHHLCIALVDGEPAGFISGVEVTHPDKGTEMFLYELGVDEALQGRGIGKALINALADRARERGCYGMWVVTDADNTVARQAYRSAGGVEHAEQVMLDWQFADPEVTKHE